MNQRWEKENEHGTLELFISDGHLYWIGHEDNRIRRWTGPKTKWQLVLGWGGHPKPQQWVDTTEGYIE